MKVINQLFALAAGALLITACTSDDDLAPANSNFPADGVIRVFTNVAEPQTRAGMTTDNLTGFDLRVINESNGTYTYHARMEKQGGIWASFEPSVSSPLTPLTMLWQNKTQKVKVTAVSNVPSLLPNQWSDGVTVNVNELQNQEVFLQNSDILLMKEKEIDPAADLTQDGKMQIRMNHRLAKLNITAILGSEFNKLANGTATNPITAITVGGTNLTAIWKINEDVIANFSNIKDVTPWYNAAAYVAGEGDTQKAEAKYECVLIPQTIGANTFFVSLTINGKTYLWRSSSELKLDADTKYNLTLNVGKEVVTVGGFTAIPWSDGGTSDIETE